MRWATKVIKSESIAEFDEYADYRERLLPWEECEISVDDYCCQLDLPGTVERRAVNQTFKKRSGAVEKLLLGVAVIKR